MVAWHVSVTCLDAENISIFTGNASGVWCAEIVPCVWTKEEIIGIKCQKQIRKISIWRSAWVTLKIKICKVWEARKTMCSLGFCCRSYSGIMKLQVLQFLRQLHTWPGHLTSSLSLFVLCGSGPGSTTFVNIAISRLICEAREMAWVPLAGQSGYLARQESASCLDSWKHCTTVWSALTIQARVFWQCNWQCCIFQISSCVSGGNFNIKQSLTSRCMGKLTGIAAFGHSTPVMGASRQNEDAGNIFLWLNYWSQRYLETTVPKSGLELETGSLCLELSARNWCGRGGQEDEKTKSVSVKFLLRLKECNDALKYSRKAVVYSSPGMGND